MTFRKIKKQKITSKVKLDMAIISLQAERRSCENQHDSFAKSKLERAEPIDSSSIICSFVTFVGFNRSRVFNIIWSDDLTLPPDLYEELDLNVQTALFICNGSTFTDDRRLLQCIPPGSVVYCCQRVLGGMKRLGGRIDDVFPAVKQTRGLDKHASQTASLLEESHGHDHGHDKSQSGHDSGVCEAVLWIENLDVEEKSYFKFSSHDLAAVETVEGLCAFLHHNLQYEQCSTDNKRSLKSLQMVNEENVAVPFMIMDSSSSKAVMRQGGEPWSFEENSMRSPVQIKLGAANIFQQFSSKCLEIFCNPSYYEIEKPRDGTIYNFLQLPALTLSKQQQNLCTVLREGLSCTERGWHAGPETSCSSEPLTAVAIQPHGDNWISQIFLDSILPIHLGMSSRDEDTIVGHETLALSRLKSFMQDREKGRCTLKSKLENQNGSELRSGEKCYRSIFFQCNGRGSGNQLCSHFVRYNYAKPYSTDGNAPVFLKGESKRVYEGHSCDQSSTVARVGRPLQGRPAMPPEHLQRAIWCVNCYVPLRQVVAAFGHNPLDYAQFSKVLRQFRDAIRYRLRTENEDDMAVLINYLKDRLEKGHTAFVCVEGVAGSVNQLRIILLSAEQIMFLKEFLITLISLDFVYKLIPNVGLCFGHFTTMGPSGHLISLATFLLESEGGDAIDWVFKKFQEVLQTFGIECQSLVRNKKI